MGGVLKIARRIWEVGVAGSPVIGRRRKAFSTLLAAWQQKRTQNVSEYMLVLACTRSMPGYLFLRKELPLGGRDDCTLR